MYPLDKQRTAYSVLRMGFSFGLMLGYLLSIFLNHYILSWIILSFVIVSLITYSVLIFKTQTRQQLLPCLYRKVDNSAVENNTSSDKKEGLSGVPNGDTVAVDNETL